MTDNQDINKWIDLHKDKIESTAEALAVEDILADKIAEMREQERRNALNIDPREDVRLNYFKGFSVIKTNDIMETAEYILRLTDKLSREKSKQAYYLQEKERFLVLLWKSN